MTHYKKILAVGSVLIFFAGAFFLYRNFTDNTYAPIITDLNELDEKPSQEDKPVQEKTLKNESIKDDPNINAGEILPKSVLLDVPFLAQAPFAVWDPLHEDACEEASLIMVKQFQTKKTSIDPNEGDVEIRKMIAYEEKNGYGISITMQQLDVIAKNYYGMANGRLEENITNDDIKKELAAGHPVIVPAAGKILPNPNFRNGGPIYHMLVVVGYDQNGFITNDPGTRKGEGFRYAFNDLFNAIHDWDENNIYNGKKTYLVFD